MSKNPPAHLRPETRKWWKEVVETFAMESHHLRLLACACEAWDRMQGAREALAEHGVTYTDRFGAPKKRPEVSVEENSRVSFIRIVREMALDSSPSEAPRPPALNRR